jgi:aspartokinase
VTISALSQTTNLLLKAIDEAVSGGDHAECYAKIFNRHMHLAVTAGLTSMQASAASGTASEPDTAAEAAAVASTPELQPLVKLLEDLKRILEGVKMTEDASPRIRARICSFGNLVCSVSAKFGNDQKVENVYLEKHFSSNSCFLLLSAGELMSTHIGILILNRALGRNYAYLSDKHKHPAGSDTSHSAVRVLSTGLLVSQHREDETVGETW